MIVIIHEESGVKIVKREEVGSEVDLESAEGIRALSPEQLSRVKPMLREKRFEKQQVLYFEGHPCDRFWIMRTGTVRLYKSSSTGQLTTLDVLGPGEIFGVLSPGPDESYPCGAEAVTAGSAWWLPRASFLQLLEIEPRLSSEILSVISRRLREAHDRLRSLAQDAAPARLASALLRATHDGEAHVTRRALAESAGTTVETAIRVMRRFQSQGVVRGELGRVVVLDEDTLRALAQGD